MARISLEQIKAHCRRHRRENFAASQRLEGILFAITLPAAKSLPTREALRKKYAADRA
ncbi:MAG: DUF2559 domain-containing protein [Lysobacterales bacterium CG_4_9_14_3_um_filter_62_6]|nr:MAG: DUF2559 domain-containing protein [Xanthomonadales bacterium CG_4_9_14_3_um_filter_62_6]